MIESYGISNVGCVRTENEDRILVDHSLMLFSVADGMGGHTHGERAAELAISSLHYYVESSRDPLDVTWPFGYDFQLSFNANRLLTGVLLAHAQVRRHSQEDPHHFGMGTTVAAVLLANEVATIANVGDSRVYRFRGRELTQLSVDDTWIATLTAGGGLTEAQAQAHPMRNALTQAAGVQENLNVHVREETLQSDDLLLLTSDGLHAVAGHDAMCSIIASNTELQKMAEHLIEEARGRGGPDNASVVAVRFST
jgi:PPM family protein phosphatase